MTLFLRIFASLIFVTVSQPAFAKTVTCIASLGGQQTVLEFDADTVAFRSLREKWSPFAPSCPSEAIIAKLKPDVDPKHWKGYCLITDENGSYVAAIAGVGNRFGRCPKEGAVCKVVNDATEYAVVTAAGFAGSVLGTNASMAAVGATVVQHSSGAWILTGTTGYIAGTLGTVGTTALGIATAPAAIVGAAAGAVVVGSAVLICKN